MDYEMNKNYEERPHSRKNKKKTKTKQEKLCGKMRKNAKRKITRVQSAEKKIDGLAHSSRTSEWEPSRAKRKEGKQDDGR